MSRSQRYQDSCDRTLTNLFRNLASDEAYVSYLSLVTVATFNRSKSADRTLLSILSLTSKKLSI